MPGMPRGNKKATAIAYDLIGKPENLQNFATKKERKINKRLTAEDAQWVR